jgi:putative transposase
MRYAQGGGLTAERRRARERLRREAAERFTRGEKNSLIAKDLRVTERSVERWRRAWREGGTEGLASLGSPGRPRLNDAQFAVLEGELAKGPTAHGWKDQRWTLALKFPPDLGQWVVMLRGRDLVAAGSVSRVG